MPRTPNPASPGKGNRTSNRYKGGTPRRTVVIDKDLARELRRINPDIRIDNLVHTLLVQFLADLQEKKDATSERADVSLSGPP